MNELDVIRFALFGLVALLLFHDYNSLDFGNVAQVYWYTSLALITTAFLAVDTLFHGVLRGWIRVLIIFYAILRTFYLIKNIDASVPSPASLWTTLVIFISLFVLALIPDDPDIRLSKKAKASIALTLFVLAYLLISFSLLARQALTLCV